MYPRRRHRIKDIFLKIRLSKLDKNEIKKKMSLYGFTNISEYIRVMAKKGILNIKENS